MTIVVLHANLAPVKHQGRKASTAKNAVEALQTFQLTYKRLLENMIELHYDIHASLCESKERCRL